MHSASLMTRCTDKMSELAAKVAEICNKYIKSVMNTGWMETHVRESSGWESRTRGKRIACTGNEEHHSLDTVRRKLFSAVKSNHMMFRASPKGLHGSPQDKMTSQQKMLQHPHNRMATRLQHFVPPLACWKNRYKFQTNKKKRAKSATVPKVYGGWSKQEPETTDCPMTNSDS